MDKIWKYIHQQQDILREIMFQDIRKKIQGKFNILNVDRIVFVGTGSSFNVAVASRQMFVTCTNKEILVTNPSDLLDSNISIGENTLVIGISQSGKSNNTNNAFQYVQQKGAATLSITFNEESPITLYSDIVIPLLCGEEKVGAKTKGYTGTLLTLHLLAISFGILNNTVSEAFSDAMKEDINRLINHYGDIIESSCKWLKNHPAWYKADSIYIVGGKGNLGTVSEGTLKILEMYRKPILGFEINEFIHGPYNAVGEGDFIIFLNNDEVDGQMDRLIEFIGDKTNNYCIIDSKQPETVDNHRIVLPKGRSIVSNLISIVPLQVFAYNLARHQGIDPGIPRYTTMHDFMGSKLGLVNFN